MLRTLLTTILAISAAAPAFAGAPIPLPVIGATGPVGIGIALAGYVGYRLLRGKK
jgi:hypothetical protein